MEKWLEEIIEEENLEKAKEAIKKGKNLQDIADILELPFSEIEELERESKLRRLMSLPYQKVIIAAKEGEYVGCIPELKGCITQSETKAEILDLLEDAKACWLEAALEDGIDIPEPQQSRIELYESLKKE